MVRLTGERCKEPRRTVCDSDGVRPTSPFAYLAAVLLVLVGWVLATAVAAGAWDPVRNATLTPVTEKLADAKNRTLAVYTDISQPERKIRCAVRDPKGVRNYVPPAALDITVDSDGSQWHLVALMPEGRDGLIVRCASPDGRVDNATYAYAVIDGFTSRGRLGQGIAAGGVLAGLGLGVWTFWSRRRVREASA